MQRASNAVETANVKPASASAILPTRATIVGSPRRKWMGLMRTWVHIVSTSATPAIHRVMLRLIPDARIPAGTSALLIPKRRHCSTRPPASEAQQRFRRATINAMRSAVPD